MIKFIIDYWGLILIVLASCGLAAAYLLTDNPENNKDMHKTTQEVEDIMKARKETRIRQELQNQAEAKYISDYYKQRNETIF